MQEERIREHLIELYGQDQAKLALPKIMGLLAKFRGDRCEANEKNPIRRGQLSEKDIILITYADQFSSAEVATLQSLQEFLATYIGDTFSGVHILPFFPYTSDDGFSISDYRQIRQDLGIWKDIEEIGQNYRLMFDAVINHVSQQSHWFRAFLRDEAPYNDFFIVVEPSADLSKVVRPRTSSLTKSVQTSSGEKDVWTTFSEDQIDLNYANPEVLIEVIDLLLFYVDKGADIIRLDAVAYLWKEIGTSSIHLSQTHHIIKLLRAVLDSVAPEVFLISETNVPHEENVQYFGHPLSNSEIYDEAQLVYQFSLAPLILHSFITGNSVALTNWAQGLKSLSPSTTYFNFIASHDGIGMIPAKDLLTQNEINALAKRAVAHGGHVSYKTNSDGSQSPYELNITLFDALNNPQTQIDEQAIQRFMASQAILLSLAGVPGIYIHSLFGSHNNQYLVAATGIPRSGNRERFRLKEVQSELDDPSSLKANVFSRYMHLLKLRKQAPAFKPIAGQRVLLLGNNLFSIVRGSSNEKETVVCITNVSEIKQNLQLNLREHELPNDGTWQDLISDTIYRSKNGELSLFINGYQAIWLKYRENRA